MSPILSKNIRPIQQMEAAECGVACLAMMLDYHGASIPLDELRAHCGTSRDGNSALQILQAARKLGMNGRGMKLTLEQLAAARTPLILHWNMNHFVVFERFSRGHAMLIDRRRGACRPTCSISASASRAWHCRWHQGPTS